MKNVVSAFILFVGTVTTQARDWGLSRDMVTESASDTVHIQNSSSADTLHIDSISLEMLSTGAQAYVVFTTPSQAAPTYSRGYDIMFTSGTTYYMTSHPNTLMVEPNESLPLRNWFLDANLVVPPSQPVRSDSMAVRLVFFASAGRGRDTLELRGHGDLIPVSLRSRVQGGKSQVVPNGVSVDPRGRRLESARSGGHPFSTPVLSR